MPNLTKFLVSVKLSLGPNTVDQLDKCIKLCQGVERLCLEILNDEPEELNL